jgi:hypothetical protein
MLLFLYERDSGQRGETPRLGLRSQEGRALARAREVVGDPPHAVYGAGSSPVH